MLSPQPYTRTVPVLVRTVAQFNTDVDSGIIRISQLIYGICPGMSQATLFNTEQTGNCKTIDLSFSTQTDGTVSFCF